MIRGRWLKCVLAVEVTNAMLGAQRRANVTVVAGTAPIGGRNYVFDLVRAERLEYRLKDTRSFPSHQIEANGQ